MRHDLGQIEKTRKVSTDPFDSINVPILDINIKEGSTSTLGPIVPSEHYLAEEEEGHCENWSIVITNPALARKNGLTD